ncbi:hypothetical protein ACWF95_33985 [Streptomyces vinaceus]
MSNLPRHPRVPSMQVNPDARTTPDRPRVLVVGRVAKAVCKHCDGFEAAVRIGKPLVTVACPKCSPTPAQAGVIEDIEREDDRRGYEADDLHTAGAVA